MTEIELLKQQNNQLSAALQTSQQQNQNLLKRLEQYEQAYQLVQQQLAELRRHRFGKKSERFIDPENPQIALFAEEKQPASAIDDSAQTVEVPAHKRKKKKSKDTSNLPRDIQVIAVAPEEMTCACGCQKQVINYETKELFHHEPARFCVIEQRREVVACPKGCQASVSTAPAPRHILPKVKATEELLAMTVVSKLSHRQPLYHLEKYTNLAGLSRETLARWHINLVPALQPIYNLLKDAVLDYDIASVDATMLQVLNEPGRNPETKSYVYCIRGGPPEKSVVLYAYNALEHKRFIDDWFEGFSGSIHMDADIFWETLLSDPGVHASYCNAHARRYFEKIVKQTKQKEGLAYEAMGFFKAIYKLEREAKRDKLSALERHAFRLSHIQPILSNFKAWLDEHYPEVMPKSSLGQAFAYALKHWNGLTHFLSDGRLEADNNGTEQEIKPFVIARKNFMFSYSVQGAHALCMHMSLLRTARLHKLDPYKYLVALYKQIPHCETADAYARLLPWTIALDKLPV